MVLNDTGDAAQLQFAVMAGNAPAVALEVNAPTFVQVTGDALAETLTLVGGGGENGQAAARAVK